MANLLITKVLVQGQRKIEENQFYRIIFMPLIMLLIKSAISIADLFFHCVSCLHDLPDFSS